MCYLSQFLCANSVYNDVNYFTIIRQLRIVVIKIIRRSSENGLWNQTTNNMQNTLKH